MDALFIVVVLAGVAGLALVALSTPFVGSRLLRTLQVHPPPTEALLARGADAVIVMGGDMNTHAPEYGGRTVGRLTLERLRFAARLWRTTGIPILVTGGRPPNGKTSLAEHMRDALEYDFGAPVRWVEDRAQDTWQNATMSAAILEAEGARTVFVVTHAWHMPRALAALATTGLTAVPLPIGKLRRPTPLRNDFVPSVAGLQNSLWAINEWLGLLGMRLGGHRWAQPRTSAPDPAHPTFHSASTPRLHKDAIPPEAR
jgi:uncharacterized SAM-binding protein YcdF (DUF218 family)